MVSSATFATWIAPRHLDDGWLPSMFEPEVMEILAVIERSAGEYQSLGDFCDLNRQAELGEFEDDQLNPVDCRWIFDYRAVRRTRTTDFESKTNSIVRLPSEAVLVGRRVFDRPSIQYWNEGVFQGAGCFDRMKFILLVPTSVGSTAWLSEALNQDYALPQIQRLSFGSTIPFITQEQLQNVKVKLPTEGEEPAFAAMAMQRIGASADVLRMRRIKKTVLLSGQTLEERLTQFEQFITEEGLFDTRDYFYVEPANPNNRNSNLFVASSRIPGKKKRLQDAGFKAVEDQEIATDWREWFWDVSTQEDYRVFNSTVGGKELPSFLISLLPCPPSHDELFLDRGIERTLPQFSLFRDSVNTHDADATEADFANDWAEIWKGLNKIDASEIERSLTADISGRFIQNIFDWARQVYRPVLVVKVRRDGQPAGAYVFFGDSEIGNSDEVFAQLDDLGFQFAEILAPTSESIESASRRESLRRLSWLMHQLNGPIGRARNAFTDLQECLDENPLIAEQLVPTEEKAKRRAAMPGNSPLQEQTLASRLNVAVKAVNDIRAISYQIKRLKRVQGNLPMKQFDLSKVLSDLSNACRERMPELSLTLAVEEQLVVSGNEESLREALEEVVNNACRELEQHKVDKPRLEIHCEITDSKAILKVRDNALPSLETISVDDPFKEDASSYSQLGKGTGLGLAIVRETFRAHNGICELKENRNEDGRVPGVTFIATMDA